MSDGFNGNHIKTITATMQLTLDYNTTKWRIDPKKGYLFKASFGASLKPKYNINKRENDGLYVS